MRVLILVLAISCFLTGPATAVVSTETTLTVADGQLAATLQLPDGEGPWPVVLILAGSGQVDRDGNLAGIPGKNNSLRQLAVGLAERGVASLRTDKRGVGGSRSAGLSETDLRFSHFVEDAVQWTVWLQEDVRFSAVTIVGHSQGAQVGMMAAWLAGADGFVSLAGPGRPIVDVMREQFRTRLPIRTRVKAEAVLAELEAGRLVPDPPTEMTIILRPSVQEFLISWQRLDPQRDLSRLSCPVAIIQGLTDIQVTETDARLLHAAKPQATLLLLPGINHLFKPVAEDNPIVHAASLTNPELQFSPEAVDAVAELTVAAEKFHQAWGAALDRVVQYNRRDGGIPPGEFDWGPDYAAQPVGRKMVAWLLNQAKESFGYRFGLDAEGYATQGRLTVDGHYNCVSYMYRVTELARARDWRDSLAWALRTRFAGAHPDSVVGPDGRVDYDRPEHLDFSLDMIRSGTWGRDVSAEVGVTVVDTVGTARYPVGSFAWVPADSLDYSQLQLGDIVWLVLNPDHTKARKLRDEYGLAIGHIGMMGKAWQGDGFKLFHAASQDLAGEYKGDQVVDVDLVTYLQRVDRYAGVIVTRLE